MIGATCQIPNQWRPESTAVGLEAKSRQHSAGKARTPLGLPACFSPSTPCAGQTVDSMPELEAEQLLVGRTAPHRICTCVYVRYTNGRTCAQVANAKLEKEVESLKVMVNDTAEQRNGFRTHADSLAVELVQHQEELVRLRQQAMELQRSNETLSQQQSAKDAEQEQVRQRWALQLEQAERDFNDMRQQLIPPADLEAMRFQLIEDAQAPWRTRVAALEAELEQTKGMFAAQRRESEQLKERLDSASHEQRAAVRELETRHEMVEAELRAKLELRAGGGVASEVVDLERARRLQKENAELAVRQQKLLEELEQLRAENENLLSVRNHLVVAQARAAGRRKLRVANRGERERASPRIRLRA